MSKHFLSSLTGISLISKTAPSYAGASGRWHKRVSRTAPRGVGLFHRIDPGVRPADPRGGTRVPLVPYEILAPLGAGGMDDGSPREVWNRISSTDEDFDGARAPSIGS